MLTVNGIKDVTTTIQNPQANAICEQLHQTINTYLGTVRHHYPPQSPLQLNDIIDKCSAAAAYVFKAAIHCKLNIESFTRCIGFSQRHDIEYSTYYRSTATL